MFKDIYQYGVSLRTLVVRPEQALTHPAALVLLKRFDGEVKLAPPEAAAKSPGEPKKD